MANFNVFSRRWNENGSFDFKKEFPDIEYDDILDKSSFKPDSENMRLQSLTGAGGKVGVFDTDIPSDLAVQIRSGKFDRAEIAQKIKEASEKLSDDVNSELSDIEAKKLSDIQKARQDYLDSKTGFNPSGKSNG